jgi:CheY-like chemotaxis protein/anti-sigma regulatory factor (Ser/Thr protein kinase)
MAAAKGLALTVVPCGLAVDSDPAYLRRILQNLIGNAIRYTLRGRVLVGARRRGGMVRLEVWDTGPGIPEEAQDDIFKEFHRLNARASASEGMGLGLAIVERACALLGHPLELRSVVGRGTCFLVQVPRSETGPGTVASPERRAREPHAADRIAFLVENDARLRREMGVVLEKWGMTVLEAGSGEEALALIEEIGILPDIVLVGEHLGAGISGIEFVTRIRARHGPVPARLISANRGWDLRAAATGAGIEILYKPIEPRALQAVVAGL